VVDRTHHKYVVVAFGAGMGPGIGAARRRDRRRETSSRRPLVAGPDRRRSSSPLGRDRRSRSWAGELCGWQYPETISRVSTGPTPETPAAFDDRPGPC